VEEIEELYLDLILDHYRNPRNFGTVPHPTHSALGHNPLCGDRIELSLELEGDTITDLKFQGEGCAISTASASLMTETVKGLPRKEALAFLSHFLEYILNDKEPPEEEKKRWGSLTSLLGVKKYPVRIKCLTLPWRTLQSALTGEKGKVSTE